MADCVGRDKGSSPQTSSAEANGFAAADGAAPHLGSTERGRSPASELDVSQQAQPRATPAPHPHTDDKGVTTPVETAACGAGEAPTHPPKVSPDTGRGTSRPPPESPPPSHLGLGEDDGQANRATDLSPEPYRHQPYLDPRPSNEPYDLDRAYYGDQNWQRSDPRSDLVGLTDHGAWAHRHARRTSLPSEGGLRLTESHGPQGALGYPPRGRSVVGSSVHEWMDHLEDMDDPYRGHRDFSRGHRGPSRGYQDLGPDYHHSHYDTGRRLSGVNDPELQRYPRALSPTPSYTHWDHHHGDPIQGALERSTDLNHRLLARLEAQEEEARAYGSHREARPRHRSRPSAAASRPPRDDADRREPARLARADPDMRYAHDVRANNRADSIIRPTGRRAGLGPLEHVPGGANGAAGGRGGRDASTRARAPDQGGLPLPHGGGGGSPSPQGSGVAMPPPVGDVSAVIAPPNPNRRQQGQKRAYQETIEPSNVGSITGVTLPPSTLQTRSLVGSVRSQDDSEDSSEESSGGESEIKPEDSVSQVKRRKEEVIKTPPPLPVPVAEVSGNAEAERVYLVRWNEGMDALGDYLNLDKPDPVVKVDVRERVRVEGDPVFVSVQPRTLPPHKRLTEALAEYEGKAKDPKVTKFSPITKFKAAYYEPLGIDTFLQPAKLPETWDSLGKDTNKGEDEPLKVKEQTFRELLAGQSVRSQIHDAMDAVIKVLPAEAGTHAQTLKNLSYLMHKVSVQEVDYTASWFGTTLLRRRDNHLKSTSIDLSAEEVRELRGSSFSSNSLFGACTPEFVKQALERHDKKEERKTRSKPTPVYNVANPPRAPQVKPVQNPTPATATAPAQQTQQSTKAYQAKHKPKGTKKPWHKGGGKGGNKPTKKGPSKKGPNPPTNK